MLLRHSKIAAAAAALVLVTASSAGAVVLWDQSNWTTTNEGSLDVSSTSCSQISGNTKVHVANDVHFSQPVHITTVRTYETLGNVQAATQAFLYIVAKTGTLPTGSNTDVEALAISKPITSTTVTSGSVTAVQVTCANLSIDLPAGDYWVSLTPRHSVGTFPYSVHLVTSGAVVGDPSAAIVACTANSNWVYPLSPNLYDYAIKIEGDFPVATLQGTWGRIKQIYR